jgi:hypothetical protein
VFVVENRSPAFFSADSSFSSSIGLNSFGLHRHRFAVSLVAHLRAEGAAGPSSELIHSRINRCANGRRNSLRMRSCQSLDLKLFRIRTYKRHGEGWVASDGPNSYGGKLQVVNFLESNSCASEKNNCPRMILLCKSENNCPGMTLLHKKVGGGVGGGNFEATH